MRTFSRYKTDSPFPMNRFASIGLNTYRALTSQARRKPDFLIVGASKCGTTSLYNYLISHPRIAPARRKEIHYFDTGFERGSAWYLSNFPLGSPLRKSKTGGAGVLTGEASPYYIFHPHALRRISEAFPNILIMIMLRNPVDRAYSHYQYTVKLGYETLSFEDALAAEDERLEGEVEKMLADEKYYSFSHQHHSYLSRGIYADQLQRLKSLGFENEQLLILKYEDFFSNPAGGMPKLWKFLDLPDYRLSNFKKLNAGNYGKMATATRGHLRQFFESHNRRLSEMLGSEFLWDQT
jgi:hypothetical protein